MVELHPAPGLDADAAEHRPGDALALRWAVAGYRCFYDAFADADAQLILLMEKRPWVSELMH